MTAANEFLTASVQRVVQSLVINKIGRQIFEKYALPL